MGLDHGRPRVRLDELEQRRSGLRDVHADRHRRAAVARAVAISVDTTNPNHAIIAFSGYNSTTPTTPGHIFDVVYNPALGTAVWTDISNDFGDQPANDVVLDAKTGDVYASTDFSALKRASGTTTWVPAAVGLPQVTVNGLTLAPTKQGARLLYAATHGRGAFRLRLP